MSDTSDEKYFWGRQLLRSSQLYPLRAEMQAFVDENPLPEDPKELRRRISGGSKLSDIVLEDREERV